MPGSDSNRILIVDDDTEWHDALGPLLERRGYEVISAFDYGDALQQTYRMDPLPILGIIDLRLPISGAPPSLDEGIRLLSSLSSIGIFSIVVSAFIPVVQDTISDRPEVLGLVDKIRFVDEGYADFFLAKVDNAVGYSISNRRAELKLPEQIDLLRSVR